MREIVGFAGEKARISTILAIFLSTRPRISDLPPRLREQEEGRAEREQVTKPEIFSLPR